MKEGSLGQTMFDNRCHNMMKTAHISDTEWAICEMSKISIKYKKGLITEDAEKESSIQEGKFDDVVLQFHSIYNKICVEMIDELLKIISENHIVMKYNDIYLWMCLGIIIDEKQLEILTKRIKRRSDSYLNTILPMLYGNLFLY